MKQISKAIIEVMKSVKGIDKNLKVGEGKASYQGVADQDVKKIIGEAMAKNGLVILPIEIEPKVTIERWEAEETWNNKTQIKQKQSVFTEVKTKYMLLHESGESVEISGYGHGIDSQDKGAGKATTYALKYALLYAFLVPTGKIDDADTTHSDTVEIPKKQPKKGAQKPKEQLTPAHKHWDSIVAKMAGGVTLEKVKESFEIEPKRQTELLEQVEQYKEYLENQKTQ